MKIHTTNEEFEYRIKNVLKRFLSDLDKNAEDLQPDEFDKLLWDNIEIFGQCVYENMFERMSEEDWLKLLKGE